MVLITNATTISKGNNYLIVETYLTLTKVVDEDIEA